MGVGGMSTEESVILILGTCCIGVNAVWVLRKLCTVQGLRCFNGGAAMAAVRLLRRVTKRASKEREEIDVVVDAKVGQQKVESCMQISVVMCIIFLLNMLLTMYRIAACQQRYFTPFQDFLWLASYACLLCMQVLPRISNRIFVDFYYSVMMLLGTLCMSPWAIQRESLMEIVGPVNFIYILLTLWLPSFAVSAFWTVCLMLSIYGSIIYHAPLPGIVHLDWVAVFEILLGAVCVCLGYVLEASMWAKTRAVVEAEATREVYAAACAMLRSFCDVVVDLDAEGRIIGDGYDLGGFLLRGRSLKGQRIDELLFNEADRLALLEKLNAPRQDRGSLADLIHVHIRDGNGAVLRMQLFWFGYKGLQSQFRCMVGLRRFADDRTVEGQGASFEQQRDAAHRQVGQDPPADSLGEQEAFAVVSLEEQGWPVESYSSGFGMKVGRLPHRALLLGHVLNGQEFKAWILQALHNLLAADQEQVRPQERFRVRLRGRMGRVSASVTVEPFFMRGGDTDSEGGEQPRVRLFFSDIRRHGSGVKHGGLSTAMRQKIDNEADGCSSSSGSESSRRRQLGTAPQPAPQTYGDLSNSGLALQNMAL
mmetsp:Transcript_115409/g.306875  ORF Transcript_115409/g.306875 Transcript_115409/m.306875 type:complete len:592 (-) Transcript_115409:104-1879(-)